MTPEGEVELRSEYMESGIDEAEHPEERGLLYIEPIGSGESYRDLEDFIELVTDRRARDLLERAIAVVVRSGASRTRSSSSQSSGRRGSGFTTRA